MTDISLTAIDNGTVENDGTGESAYDAFARANTNIEALRTQWKGGTESDFQSAGINDDATATRLELTDAELRLGGSLGSFLVRAGVGGAGYYTEYSGGTALNSGGNIRVYSSTSGANQKTRIRVDGTAYISVGSDGIVHEAFLEKHVPNTGITAFAGGGQGSAVELTAAFNEVSTVATTADSVKLPSAAAGYKVTVINNGANSANVFPNTSDDIDGTGVDTAVALAAGANATYYAYDSTNWVTLT